MITALLHTFGGQQDLLNPLMQSNLSAQAKAEWFGAWHMITLLLFGTSYYIFKNAYSKIQSIETMQQVGYLYMLVSLAFVVSSILHQLLAPQWILLLPIGVLILIGNKKAKVV